MKSWFRRTDPMRFIRRLFSVSSPQTLPQAKISVTADGAERQKILIVDDDPIILKTLSLKLEAAGYAVATAADGSDALGALREHQPDLVLLDINFPPDIAHGGGVPWDGFLLMKWLRGIERVGKVPIIFITGDDSSKCRERALACGAKGFCTKPIDMECLLATTNRVLNGKAPPQFSRQANYQI